VTQKLTLYVDFRSPFSFLAKDLAFALAQDLALELAWRPFHIDLEGAYGGTVEQRSERDWRKVKYLYMDARRLAHKRGLTIRGTVKIFDPTLAHIAMLLAGDTGADVFRRFYDAASERFWRRELDIEDWAVVRAAVVAAGADGAAFDRLVDSGEGAARCRAIVAEGEARGVFGVPTFVVDETGELFWGTDRMAMLRERLVEAQSGPSIEQ
jgi:2-hydroxychromene-2-carboxylate isomerase